MKKKPLPKMFIGSSTEGKPVVRQIVEVFSDLAACIPWNIAPEFKSSGSFATFNALCDAARGYDFALFVLTSDDILNHRNEQYSCPRDNVIFEMGLFIGAIGPDRVFACVQDTSDQGMKIPSDLLGVNMPRFLFNKDDPESSIASINAEMQKFASVVDKLGFHSINLNLAEGWGFKTDNHRRFEVKLGAGPLTSARSTIRDYALGIAARVRNDTINFEDDEQVVFSESRSLPNPLGDMIFQIQEDQFPETIASGTTIEGRVLLLPKSLNLKRCQSLSEAMGWGCRIVEPIKVRADSNLESNQFRPHSGSDRSYPEI